MHHKSNTSVNTLFIVPQTANPLLPSVILLLIPFTSEFTGAAQRTAMTRIKINHGVICCIARLFPAADIEKSENIFRINIHPCDKVSARKITKPTVTTTKL